jgi:hypothetical protein
LITGGSPSSEGAHGPSSTAEIFDPTTGTFDAIPPMSVARVDHTATLLNNGLVLIAGGYGAELYDPSTNSFSSTGSMTTFRSYHSATLLADGTVLIASEWSTYCRSE